MPKGVEHEVLAGVASQQAAVPNSVMPKGVEHDNSDSPFFPANLGAEFSDAERR